MISSRLHNHVKLCRRNLKSERVRCCAQCPFEDDIVKAYPEMVKAFEKKRAQLSKKKGVSR